MALTGSTTPSRNRRRLCDALEAFEPSLQLDPDNMGKNIRAWTSESTAYNALGLYEDEVRCCLCALEARIARHFLLYSSINVTIRKVRPSCVPSKERVLQFRNFRAFATRARSHATAVAGCASLACCAECCAQPRASADVLAVYVRADVLKLVEHRMRNQGGRRPGYLRSGVLWGNL